jgi:uncharacterized protein involved in oxidation of intracellular sulfur
MTSTLLVLNDAPFGSERSYNGLRLAGSLAHRDDEQVRVFLMGDAATCAKSGQKVAHGYYNIELMLGPVLRRGGEIGVCSTCMDSLAEAELASRLPQGHSRRAGRLDSGCRPGPRLPVRNVSLGTVTLVN